MNPYGFRETQRPRFYYQRPIKERHSRKFGVAVAVGVVVVAIGMWWAAKV